MPDPARSSEQFLAISRRVAERTRARNWRRAIGAIVLLLLAVAVAAAIYFCRPPGGARNAAAPADPKESQRSAAEVRYAWVQMLPGEPGERLARAIVAKSSRCPDIVVDTASRPMFERPAPVRASFPILLCEARINASGAARIGSVKLPARPEDPTHIVAIGDTGCRVVYWTSQSCGESADWPFARIAASAKRAIDQVQRPSIIIHVGDYHYREHACHDRDPSCSGTPYGDNWATWEEEFFKPAAPLLLAAPWVLLRGNHEDCERAGAGWLFFFALPDQQKKQFSKACENDLDSEKVAIGRTEDGSRRWLFVFDTAAEDDRYNFKERCEAFERWIDTLVPTDPGKKAENWLALHQPLWRRNSDGKRGPEALQSSCTDSKSQSKSALDAIRAKFATAASRRIARLVLVGDSHVFQFFRPTDNALPTQIVVGNGGTKLDALRHMDEGDRTETATDPITTFGATGSFVTVAKHGYTVLTRDKWLWNVRMHDPAGKEIVACGFSEASDATASDAPAACAFK